MIQAVPLKLFGRFIHQLCYHGMGCFSYPFSQEVSQIWNFFKNIWFLHHLKALNEKFQNDGLIFQIWLGGSGDIWILVLKRGFLDKT